MRVHNKKEYFKEVRAALVFIFVLYLLMVILVDNIPLMGAHL